MIHLVLGTRAQLVKMTPVMAQLKERGIPYNFIFTGQHRATIEEMLDEFDLKKPDVCRCISSCRISASPGL